MSASAVRIPVNQSDDRNEPAVNKASGFLSYSTFLVKKREKRAAREARGVTAEISAQKDLEAYGCWHRWQHVGCQCVGEQEHGRGSKESV